MAKPGIGARHRGDRASRRGPHRGAHDRPGAGQGLRAPDRGRRDPPRRRPRARASTARRCARMTPLRRAARPSCSSCSTTFEQVVQRRHGPRRRRRRRRRHRQVAPRARIPAHARAARTCSRSTAAARRIAAAPATGPACTSCASTSTSRETDDATVVQEKVAGRIVALDGDVEQRRACRSSRCPARAAGRQHRFLGLPVNERRQTVVRGADVARTAHGCRPPARPRLRGPAVGDFRHARFPRRVRAANLAAVDARGRSPTAPTTTRLAHGIADTSSCALDGLPPEATRGMIDRRCSAPTPARSR